MPQMTTKYPSLLTVSRPSLLIILHLIYILRESCSEKGFTVSHIIHKAAQLRFWLSLADDRLVTHWLRIIGKHAPAAPLVDIELTQRADVLTSAKAKASFDHSTGCRCGNC